MRLHPMVFDRIESERCPRCGRIGEPLPVPGTVPGTHPPFEEWGCRACDPEEF